MITRFQRFIDWLLSVPSEAEPPPSQRFIAGTEYLPNESTHPGVRLDMQSRATPKVDAFLREYELLCLRHNFSITHEDDGAFIVDQYEPAWQQFVMLAQITPRVDA